MCHYAMIRHNINIQTVADASASASLGSCAPAGAAWVT